MSNTKVVCFTLTGVISIAERAKTRNRLAALLSEIASVDKDLARIGLPTNYRNKPILIQFLISILVEIIRSSVTLTTYENINLNLVLVFEKLMIPALLLEFTTLLKYLRQRFTQLSRKLRILGTCFPYKGRLRKLEVLTHAQAVLCDASREINAFYRCQLILLISLLYWSVLHALYVVIDMGPAYVSSVFFISITWIWLVQDGYQILHLIVTCESTALKVIKLFF
jgi:hypothetical protein